MKVVARETCPYCERIDLGLKLRKIPSDKIHFEIAEKNTFPEELIAINPIKTFPTLQITSNNGFGESMVILEYLDSHEANGPKLYGSSPENVGKTKFHIEILQNKVNKYLQGCIYTYNSKVDEKNAISEIKTGYENLDKILKNRNTRFFGGEELNAEDVYIIPFVMRFLAVQNQNNNIPLPAKSSRVEKYFHDVSHHSIVRKCIPSQDELMKSLNIYNGLKCKINPVEVLTSKRDLVTDLESHLANLNSHCQPLEWSLSKNDKGPFLHGKFRFKNATLAMEALKLLNELQESSDHHSSFNIENFHTLKIDLCTHQPKWGVSEKDFSFAQIYTNKIKTLT